MENADFETPSEQAAFALRRLFSRYGYKRYRVNKFEEYGIYLEYKNFLPQSPIITFTDLGGRLLAMKPDVTLSIAKNAPVDLKNPAKLFYTENVYRVPHGSREFREIAQVGLECIGNVDVYSQCETVLLACKSLETLSERYVLTLSHMGFVSGLLSWCSLPAALEEQALRYIEHKNAHELARLCQGAGLSREKCEALGSLSKLSGPIAETLESARQLVRNDAMCAAIDELQSLCDALGGAVLKECLTLDFSVINDLSYYNGLIFQGYVPDIPRAVLSGGRYDKLMEKLGKKAQAIGFAVYVNELENREGAGL
ncbi:MAG: ATP phosphoribosyltransferase regulatory subunit [Oscillospiraceae bacterium]|jgi:ATP phosphoribosyltransferase regulatory subunit|nr:ATP phosphoribosyltransferase regulatory subunit [Oscillospiraceae bacterium]